VGELWADAAIRELAEEAGITVADTELLDMGDDWYDSDVVRVVGRVYAVQHAGPFSHPDGEVQRTEWVPLAELETWLATREVCDDSLEVVVPRL
jgi:8-oxo-dGTP pyrophosphatase MutT (NUDIX family)